MFDRIIKFTFQVAVAIAVVASFATRAHAWDCSYWSQSTNPAAECYKAPGASNTVTGTQSQGQGQSQSNGQGQTQTATGGASKAVSNASSSSQSGAKAQGGSVSGVAASSTAMGGLGGSGGQSGITTSTSNSGNVTYREAANVVQPATMIIQGCQVQGQAGGSNTRAAAMLGIGFTPSSCYDYIQAEAYRAIGDIQAACEVLNHTKAAQRAVKNGATLPDCTPPAPPPVAVAPAPTERTYTREQVEEIIRRVTRK